ALIFIGTVSDIIGVRIDSKYIMAIIIWLYFLSEGYIQWFVLSKRIINK
ncbi:TPA: protein YbfB, partial [Escherichia coli]